MCIETMNLDPYLMDTMLCNTQLENLIRQFRLLHGSRKHVCQIDLKTDPLTWSETIYYTLFFLVILVFCGIEIRPSNLYEISTIR